MWKAAACQGRGTDSVMEHSRTYWKVKTVFVNVKMWQSFFPLNKPCSSVFLLLRACVQSLCKISWYFVIALYCFCCYLMSSFCYRAKWWECSQCGCSKEMEGRPKTIWRNCKSHSEKVFGTLSLILYQISVNFGWVFLLFCLKHKLNRLKSLWMSGLWERQLNE